MQVQERLRELAVRAEEDILAVRFNAVLYCYSAKNDEQLIGEAAG